MRSPRKVTLHPTFAPSLTLKLAIDFFRLRHHRLLPGDLR